MLLVDVRKDSSEMRMVCFIDGFYIRVCAGVSLYVLLYGAVDRTE